MYHNVFGECQNAPASKRNYLDKPCNSYLDCERDDETYSHCMCGYNDQGLKFCEVAPGD